jgi:hypothetical protein
MSLDSLVDAVRGELNRCELAAVVRAQHLKLARYQKKLLSIPNAHHAVLDLHA